MRKVTCFLIVVLFLAYLNDGKAQIDYHQGWEDAGAGLAGWVNTGTGGTFSRFEDATVCTGEASVRANLWDDGHVREFISPSLGLSNGQLATLSFEYKVAVWSANVVGSPCEHFTIEVFWANDLAGPWNSIGIINCDNHIISGECEPGPGVYQFTPGAGATYVRFTTTRLDGDFYMNLDEVSVTQEVIAGAPEEPFDPNPANSATDVPYDGQLTWTFGDNTNTYDLMFGTPGNMVKVVDNAVAGTSGSYSYSGLEDLTTYNWQVIVKNDFATVPGPLWSFTTLFSGGFVVIYNEGDIETDYGSPWVGPSTCPGVMTVNVPAGEWITGIDVSYNMTAQNGAWMSEQRSKIYSPTLGAGEIDYAAGAGNTVGTFSYSRTGLTFANEAHGEVVFHIDAGRTWGSTAPNDGCGVFYNKVDNGTWTLVIYCEPIPNCPVPTTLSANNLTNSTAEIGWLQAGDVDIWDILLGIQGFDPMTEGTLLTGVVDNPYTIAGLSSITDYDLYLRADCDGGELSDWAGPLSFSTLADPLSGNYTINSTQLTGGTNFNSFNDFAFAINNAGLGGPVIVDVVSGTGPYNEQVIFYEFNNSSETNTVTFNGNDETLQYSANFNNERATLKLNGTDHVIFNNIAIIATGSSYG
jgi:hypothetical protein